MVDRPEIRINATYGGEPGGATILDAIYDFLGRFIAYPSDHARVAHVLWVAHTHLMGAWESTARIAFLSPEPASGKTRALEITELLVPRPVEAVNVTSAYLFRKVGDPAGRPTVLFDEIDTVFGPKAKENEEIRGLLNAGHRRGAVAGRAAMHGKRVVTEELPAYCAVALAGLGGLPDTLLTRSMIIRMRRRTAAEVVEPYRRRVHSLEGWELRSQLETWADKIGDAAGEHWPEMPDGIADRDADVWEPLLTVADFAGGEWPDKARKAAKALVAESKRDTPSLSVRLLKDLRSIFGDREAMSTEMILGALHAMEEAPWSDMHGKPMTPRGLSSYLRRYEISSKPVRIGDFHGKGYTRADLWDAWSRYLPKPEPEAVTDVTNVTDTNGIPPNDFPSKEVGNLALISNESVTSVTSVTPTLLDGFCTVCGEPMAIVDDGQTTHPNCD